MGSYLAGKMHDTVSHREDDTGLGDEPVFMNGANSSVLQKMSAATQFIWSWLS